MNRGSKIRTLCLIIVLVNQANVSLGGVDFGNEYVNTAYKVISYLLTLAASIAAWYYNNDTSEAGAIGTGVTRQIKRELSDGYIGERFYTDEEGNLINPAELRDEVEDEDEEIVDEEEEENE